MHSQSRSSTFDSHSNYPPSPPPPRGTRAQPSLRVNTHLPSTSTSIRTAGGPSHGHSPARGGGFQTPLYDLPPSSLDSPGSMPSTHYNRARPGGLAGIAATSGAATSYIGESNQRVKSPPATPGGLRALQYRNQNAGGAGTAPGPPPSRRRSNDTTVRPVVRRGSDNSLPMPVGTRRENSRSRATTASGLRSPPPGTSVFSGREGSAYGRVEGVSSPSPAELQLFAHHCRLFYFSPNPPPDSATYISTTLASLPPSHRASYTRLQSSLRSLAHLHHLRVRVSSFHALISSTIASASLTPLARTDLGSVRARDERTERFGRYLSTWCTSSAGGVEPFFRGLWAVLRVQSRGDENRGGAGARRVVWEVDDAVFLESGGAEFMHETVMILKGVLGFTDQPLTSPPKLRRIRTIPRSYLDNKLRPPLAGFASRSRSGSSSPRPTVPRSGLSNRQPVEPEQEQELLSLDSDSKMTSHGRPAPPLPQRPDVKSARPTEPLRSRAISDPFIDPSTRSLGSSISPAKPRVASNGSSRGPAPPPPPSRKLLSNPSVVTGSIPNPLQLEHSASNNSEPLTPGWNTGSNVHSPLLNGDQNSGVDPSSVVSALEAAVERGTSSRPPLGQGRISEDQELLLGRYGSHSGRTMSDGSVEQTSGLFDQPRPNSVYGLAEDEVIMEDDDEIDDPTEDDITAEENELNKPRFRLWTFPSHITDDEAEKLMSLFPTFISQSLRSKKKMDARFPFVRPGHGMKDLESGALGESGWDNVIVDGVKEVKVPKLEVEDQEGVLRFGTGRMWVGLEVREIGWNGGRWFRFVRFWRRLFGGG